MRREERAALRPKGNGVHSLIKLGRGFWKEAN